MSRAFRVRVATVAIWGGLILGFFHFPSEAIDIDPQQKQIEEAVRQGHEAAESRVPPDQLYYWFGNREEFEAYGFLMSKIHGVTVMAAHFALRGESPSSEEIARILKEEALLINMIMFGDTPTFAADSYMVLKQENHLIKPIRVRFDAVAKRTKRWPAAPRYRAKVIAYFRYKDFDPVAPTIITVFPGVGREKSFNLNFSAIP